MAPKGRPMDTQGRLDLKIEAAPSLGFEAGRLCQPTQLSDGRTMAG